ncbi:MAG: type II toxin-antitoxin system Phd/YefM family antitoxin [Deltaproteobacteria bacterium]|nr:type II toxin-antitoxin system Phd/YefM family antitoxin [Deltaproteobacteria bacterium]
MTNYSTKEARDHFSEMINQVAFTKDRVALERRGKVVAYIVPIEDMAALEKLEDSADIREAKKIMSDVESGKESLIPWESVKSDLGL